MPIKEFKYLVDLTILRLGIALLVALVQSDVGFAKMNEEPKSFSLEAVSLEQVERKILPKVDVEKLLEEDRARDMKSQRSDLMRFAVAAEVSYRLDNSGTIQELPDGHLWQLRIHSPGATSHNLGMTRFDMPEGANLWIYDSSRGHVEGPYTFHHRTPLGGLWTPIVTGDEIWVEVFWPVAVKQPVIEISKVNQGYRDPQQTGVLGYIEAWCNVDVKCTETATSDPWGLQKSAVGHYIFKGTMIGCTGTLLNNRNTPRKELFLTANHCFEAASGITGDSYEKIASDITILWNFQSKGCVSGNGVHTPPTPPPIPPYQTQVSGAWVRAHSTPSFDDTDFLLLELKANPDTLPVPPGVHYAGWDARVIAPPTKVPAPLVGIHHPMGDVKAISTSNADGERAKWVGNTSPDGGQNDPNGDYWRISWDSGVTERISSGSCLFDSSKRCIGQLRGGTVFSSGPNFQYCPTTRVSNYGKISVSWSRLQPYLAPGSTSPIYLDGDPHITTTNGVHYDFQAAGEFVALQDPNGLEIQTRQTPVPTSHTITDPYSELPVCVSVNTAVAARVGGHRVSYQPKAGSSPSGPNVLELFVDGNSATVGPNGLDLSGGGRLTKTTVPGGLEFDFPDGSVLFTTPTWWDGQNIWYFNISLTRPPAIDGTDANSFRIGGIAGPIESGDWLPRLPNGSSMGPRPGGLDKRYVDLYQKFADAWRVKQESSLFTYPKDTSTDNFTLRSWPPPLDSPCTIPQGQILGVPHGKPVKLIKPQLASKACLGITDKHARQNCIFDVQVTSSLGFAKTYQLSERVVTKSTRTTVSEDKVRVGIKELAVFTATVAQARADGRAIPTGSVQFMVDGRKVGKPIPLDKYGQARWKTSDLQVGKHQVTSSYIPDLKKGFSPSLGTLVWHMASRD